MGFKTLKFQILHGSLTRRIVLRVFMIASAISIFTLLQFIGNLDPIMFTSVNSHDCAVNHPYLIPNRFLISVWGLESKQCKENVNLTINVVRELMGKQLLSYGAKALCVGDASPSAIVALRELGFSDARGVYRHSFFSLKHKKFVYELDYEDSSFDFVFSKDVDKVSVPALLVLEMERVIKPGGIGAVLVGLTGSNPNSLIRSATPVSSLLKGSSVVHVGYMDNFTLVVFKKKIDNVGYFGQYILPADCSSLTRNSPFIEYLEPLFEEKPMENGNRVAYLPQFIDVSSRSGPVYIYIGAGEHLNSGVTNWLFPSYPVDQRSFHVYFVDHNTSVMSHYVKKPGITFVYHPGLDGNNATVNLSIDGDLDPPYEDEVFDFLAWFKETVKHSDFVVLKMNAGKVELNFLSELFKSGAICSVDELFIHCANHSDGKSTTGSDCMDLFKGLRSSGVFVHQWWGD